MIRVAIKGGLGNQMFQYAYAKVLADTYQQPLLLDLSFFDKEGVFRGYALDRVGVKEQETKNKAKKWQISLWKKLLPLNMWLLKKGLKPLTTLYLVGYWQSERFFQGRDDFVRTLFDFPETPKVVTDEVESSNSVAVHVRRGDYVTSYNYLVCDLDYYLEAMRNMKGDIDNARFFIFSDDIEWCEAIKKDFPDAVLVDSCQSDLEELHLMMKCKHIVISNSSFSWWGAWMKEYPGKKVICPNKWNHDEKFNQFFMVEEKIVPERWRMQKVD